MNRAEIPTIQKCISVYSQQAEVSCDLKVDSIELNIAQASAKLQASAKCLYIV